MPPREESTIWVETTSIVVERWWIPHTRPSLIVFNPPRQQIQCDQRLLTNWSESSFSRGMYRGTVSRTERYNVNVAAINASLGRICWHNVVTINTTNSNAGNSNDSKHVASNVVSPSGFPFKCKISLVASSSSEWSERNELYIFIIIMILANQRLILE